MNKKIFSNIFLWHHYRKYQNLQVSIFPDLTIADLPPLLNINNNNMGQHMYSHLHSSPTLQYQSLNSQLSNYPSPRLNTSHQDLLKKSTASYRSTRSSVYSQSSKLLKSSIFQRVGKNKDVQTSAKRLEQKEVELESLKSTTSILKEKLQVLEKQLKEQVRNGRQQSKKIRGCLKQFYNN